MGAPTSPTPSPTPATKQEPQYPVVCYYNHPIQPSTLGALARTLGRTDTQCSKFSEPFAEVLFGRLCPPAGGYTTFTQMVLPDYSESSRLRVSELLRREHDAGVHERLHATSAESRNDDRTAYVAAVAAKFAQGQADKDIQELLKSSDLYRLVLPVLDTLLPTTGRYLVDRIPPHVGHGVRRTLAFESEEVIQAEKETEARQDRGAAARLLQNLKAFLTLGSVETFEVFMRSFHNSGEWLSWIAQSPRDGVPHPRAEQILANTVALLYRYREFTDAYEKEFMTPQRPAACCRWHWYETSETAAPKDPLGYPLYAGALEILTRQDFKHELPA